MTLALWQHVPTRHRYIVLVIDNIVQQAAGPLSAAQLAAAQADEWRIPWMPGVAGWAEKHRGEFMELHPRGAQS